MIIYITSPSKRRKKNKVERAVWWERGRFRCLGENAFFRTTKKFGGIFRQAIAFLGGICYNKPIKGLGVKLCPKLQ